jgi:hypothetical protein
VEVDDLRPIVIESGSEASPEEVIRPIAQARVIAAVDAVIGLEAGDVLAPEPSPPGMRDIRNVKHPDVFGLRQLAGEIVAVDLRPLRRVRRKLVDDLQD